MNKKIVEQVRKFVEDECKKPTSKYGYEPYEFHFVPVVNYAVSLAKKLNADIEIVELSAWLHDIGSIFYGRESHHITSAEITEKKLRELDYPEIKIEKVKQCILSHRSSNSVNGISLEAQIISDADALSNFDNISGIFKAAFIYENLTQGEAMISVREKLKRKWSKLYLQESKELIKPKYKAAILLLS